MNLIGNRKSAIYEFKNCRFQNEAKYKTFLVEMSFIFMEIKNCSVHIFLKQGLGNSEMAYRKIPKISPSLYKPLQI